MKKEKVKCFDGFRPVRQGPVFVRFNAYQVHAHFDRNGRAAWGSHNEVTAESARQMVGALGNESYHAGAWIMAQTPDGKCVQLVSDDVRHPTTGAPLCLRLCKELPTPIPAPKACPFEIYTDLEFPSAPAVQPALAAA